MTIKNGAKWLAIIVFLLGLLIRLYDITDEPVEVHQARQLRAAIISRSIYLQNNPFAKGAEVEYAIDLAADTGLIEPSILEFLSATTYSLIGGEQTWVGRLFSITFWMLGGLALFSMAKSISSGAGAVASLSFYLFLPFGITYSRVLLPDPMMVASTMLSIWALYNWERQRTQKWAVITGILTGYAILTKSVAAILLLVPFALFILAADPFKKTIKNKQIWTILLLAGIPSLGYYFYGIVIDGRLAQQFQGRFFSDLLIDPGFYVRWLNKVEFKFTLISVMFSGLGIALLKEHKVKMLLSGWWIGYFLIGFFFPYHIWTHIYYHLPLVPIIALSLAPVFGALMEKISQLDNKLFNYALVLSVFAAIAGYNLWTARVEMAAEDHRVVRTHWETVAGVFDETPNGKVIALTGDYGLGLSFYGNLRTTNWLRGGDLAYRSLDDGSEYNFEDLWPSTAGHRFFLITAGNEFDRQPELKSYLNNNYSVYAEGPGYLVYDLVGE
ncbi:MAG: glycosyltransferase family 39 protein [Chloroflexota bacterium]